MKCIKCKRKLDKNSEFCPNCGTPVNKDKSGKVAFIVIIIILLFIVLFIGGMYGLFSYIFAKAKNNEFVQIEDYKVPNIFYNSDYKICNYRYSDNNIGIGPCEKFKEDFMDSYIDKMIDYGYHVEERNGEKFLVREVEDGRELIVKLNNNEVIYTIE